MIRALFGQSTVPQTLRQSLDRSMRAHEEIARRVAEAVNSSSASGADAAAAGGEAGVDLAGEMSRLADTQIRYEAEARLLQLVYQNLRRAVGGNG